MTHHMIADEDKRRGKRAPSSRRRSAPVADPLLAAIVESSDDAIITKNPDGIITSWNSAAERIFGYRRDEVIGQPIYILIPPELVEEEVRLLGRLARGERIEHYETIRLRKDGTPFDASVTISPLTKGRKIMGASKILRDITARKYTEHELRRRTAELTAFVETAAIGLHWVGPDGTILWANAAEMKLLGYRPEEYIGHHISEFHADDPAVDAILGCLGRGERLCEYEARLKCKDGSIKCVVIDSSVLWEDGRFVHTQCFTRDVTERKRAEEELRKSAFILNHSGWAVATINALTNRIEFCNGAFARMHGSAVEEMTGAALMETFAPEWRPNWEEHLGNVSRAGDYIYESMHIRKDGRTFPVRTHATSFNDKNGRALFRASIFEDMTERKHAEAALRESQERYRSLFNSIDEGFCIVEVLFDGDNKAADYRFVEVNPSFERQTGLTNATGKRMRDLAPGHEDYWFEIYGRIALTGEPARFENRAEQLSRWYDVYAFRFGDPANRQVAVLFNDITDRKRTEESLARAREELEQHARTLETTVAERTGKLKETIAELESFSYSLSHDLRAPLRAIVSFSQLLSTECAQRLGAPSSDYITRIIRAADRMDRLIHDVLTYSRLVRQEVSMEPVGIEALLKQIIAEHPTFQPPAAHIEIQRPLLPVLGHEASLTQCIYNLIGNAIKFVAPGVTPRVRIWSEARDSNARIWFEDNGIGIPAESQQTIFGMFQRLHREDRYEGTGIGLAIVRKAVERMKGQVGVESRPGQGSRFWIELRRDN
jgi:PAS domain S-box-containing protein